MQSSEAVPAGDYLTLSAAAHLSPTKPSPNAVWRWCRKGIRARNGETITLQHIRIGGRVFTTKAWVERFFSQVAEADRHYFATTLPPRTSKARTHGQRQTAVERAKRELAAAGY